MKKFTVCLTFILLAFSVNSFAQDDFTVTSPTTDAYKGYIKPIKAGGTTSVQIKIKSNKKVTYTTSINTNGFTTYANWVKIDNNNSQSLAYNQTITFNLTFTVPQDALELMYSFPISLNNIDSLGNNNQYGSPIKLFLIVDNTPPVTPSVSISSRTSTSLTIVFSSIDASSKLYTDVNTTSGYMGIKSFMLALKNLDGTIKDSKSIDASSITNSWTFNNLAANTEYRAFVTATDLVGYSSTNSAGLSATTAPAPPTITSTSSTCCTITLTWSTSAGATSYKVYNSNSNPVSTTATSYTITGLAKNTLYTISVTAINGAGNECEHILHSISTADLPSPVFSSNLTMCSDDKTISVTPIEGASSYTWTVSSPLAIVGAATTNNPSVVIHVDNMYQYNPKVPISVVANLTCGFPSKKTNSFVAVPGGPPVLSFLTPMAYYNGGTYNNVCNLQNYTTSLQTLGVVTWTRIAANPTTTSWYQSGNDVSFYFYYVNQTDVFRVRVYNGCGSTSADFGFKSVNCSGTGDGGGTGGGGTKCRTPYAVSLNSSMKKIKVVPQLPAPCPEVAKNDGFVSVYDIMGKMVKQIKYTYFTEQDIDVSDLRDGVYILVIYDGNSTDTKKIFVNH